MFQSIKPKFDQAITITVSGAKYTYTTLKAKAVSSWQNHKKTILWGLAIVALALVGTLLFIYMWRRSVTFRAIVLALVTAIALNINNVLTWLKEVASSLDALAIKAETYSNGVLPGRTDEVDLEQLNILTAENPDLLSNRNNIEVRF